MDIKSMTCFLAVAEKLNFSRAAEALYMSQPTLSQRISSLEEELGVSLFQRDHRHVFLTPAGSALLPEIQDIVRRIDALPALAAMNKENQKNRKGHLKVHLDSSIPETMIRVLNRAFDKFYQLYPDITLSINSVSFGEYENALLTRQADICFIGLKSSEWINPLFNNITLAIEPMVLAYKKRPEEGITPPQNIRSVLEKRELLLLSGEDRWNAVILNYMENQKIYTTKTVINGGPALMVSLMQNISATFMPKSFFDTLNDPHLSYISFEDPDAFVYSDILWDKHNLNPSLQLLINCFDLRESPMV